VAIEQVSLRRTVTVLNSIRLLYQRWGWLIAGVLLLWLGTMFGWDRGLYSDDYLRSLELVDAVSGSRKPIWSLEQLPMFPVRSAHLTTARQLATWLADYEFWVRLGMSLATGLNAFLLGLLVQRASQSRFAALVSGWVFLSPFYAYQSVLWVTPSNYIFGGTLGLLGLHAHLTALQVTQRRRAVLWALGGFVALLGCLVFAEQSVMLLSAFPALAMVRGLNGECPTVRERVVRASAILAFSAVIAVVYGAFAYTSSSVLLNRGGLTFDIPLLLERSGDYFRTAYVMVLKPSWGMSLMREAFEAGTQALAGSSTLGFGLFAACVLSLYLSASAWTTTAEEAEPIAPRRRLLLCLGLPMFVVPLLLPGILLSGQSLEFRMLYFPGMGASVMLGALTWVAVARVNKPAIERVAVFVCGVLALAGSIALLGFSEAYARRYVLDSQQLQDVHTAIPTEMLPPSGLIVPAMFEWRLFGTDDLISMVMFGVFDAAWSADHTLRMAYQRNDVRAITANRWTGMVFEQVQAGENAGQITIQGVPCASETTILLVPHQGGLVPIELITLSGPDGSDSIFEFSAAAALRAHGSGGYRISVRAGQPQFALQALSRD
jgi:hypothetical protein